MLIKSARKFSQAVLESVHNIAMPQRKWRFWSTVAERTPLVREQRSAEKRHLQQGIVGIVNGLLDFAFPPKCLSCRSVVEQHGHICSECWDTVTIIGLHHCDICGTPFEFDQGKKAICQYCREDKPKFNAARAFCTYEGIARKLAIRLKFGDSLHLAPPMAKMMHIMGEDLVKKSDLIAPVPLHYRRRFLRRFNQSSLLGLHIAKAAGKTYEPFLLRRIRHTKQQTQLNKAERKANVKDAFSIGKNFNVKGKTILLVDDVMTTGATLSSCAKALKENGAKKVYCLVFARTMPF